MSFANLKTGYEESTDKSKNKIQCESKQTNVDELIKKYLTFNISLIVFLDEMFSVPHPHTLIVTIYTTSSSAKF